MDLPTVCIVNEKAKSGFTRINESDFDPARHVFYEPRSPVGNEDAVDIPADWRTLHHNAKIALAERINGTAGIAPIDGETKTAAAERVIEDEIAKRSEA